MPVDIFSDIFSFFYIISVAEIRKLLQANEIEKMLILFLSHSDAKVQIAASQGLRVMAENLLSRECTGKYGA